MPTTYGTTPQGFVRKPLAEILASIEAKAQTAYEALHPGAKVVQRPQSPLGQLNGYAASVAASVWEIAEATYQSYDPDQAEGVRLEQLARIRLLDRVAGETDIEFRSAITNAGRARIDLADIERAVKDVDGVTWSKVFVNETNAIDINGLDPHTIAVAALGGGDAAVAAAIREYAVPGIETYGNTLASVIVDGICRPVLFVRPVARAASLVLHVRKGADRLGCPPPSEATLRAAIVSGLSGSSRLANGETLDLHRLRLVVSSFTGIEIVSGMVQAEGDESPVALPYTVPFFDMLTISADAIEIEDA